MFMKNNWVAIATINGYFCVCLTSKFTVFGIQFWPHGLKIMSLKPMQPSGKDAYNYSSTRTRAMSENNHINLTGNLPGGAT